MMNQYPLWKYFFILIVLVLGVIYAAPNLYGEDPAVQVSLRSGAMDTEAVATRVSELLQHNNLQAIDIEQRQDSVLARFEGTEKQLAAKDALAAENGLGSNYIVAPNLVPATPEWLRALNALPMYLGLDLRGGIHFLLQIDTASSIKQAYERYRSEFRTYLREQEIRYSGVTEVKDALRIRFTDLQQRDRALDLLQKQYPDLTYTAHELDGVWLLDAALSETALLKEQDDAMEQNLTVLRNRVNEIGVAEPVIQKQGRDRIVVQLPGVQDSAKAKEILGSTATLEYRMVVGSSIDAEDAASSGRVPTNALLYKQREGNPILLERRVIVTGDQIKGAVTGFDDTNGSPAVIVTLDGKGAARMRQISSENIGKPMAVVFIEERDGRRIEEVINVATIRDVLSNRFQTTGLNLDEARDLALLLRAGALRAPMKIIEERTIGPSLGADNIDQGKLSVLVGFALVLIFMAVYYKAFGLIANLALIANVVLLVAVLSLFQATLTMPGIAGIVLTVGMAVDANVLIFERIREELRNGNSIQASIHAGYEKAFGTIFDSNITTLIAAVVLFAFGTGPIKGFAVTLSIGIATSMFTAIMITRAIVNLVYGGRRLQSLAI